MPYLGIFLDVPLELQWLIDFPCAPIVRNARTYRPFHPGSLRSVFFDWLLDSNGHVIGVELHIMPGEGVLQPNAAIRQLSYVEQDGPFPRVWFFGRRDGKGWGVEAFESFYFLTQSGDWLVLLPLAEWLTQEQCEEMLRVLSGGQKRQSP